MDNEQHDKSAKSRSPQELLHRITANQLERAGKVVAAAGVTAAFLASPSIRHIFESAFGGSLESPWLVVAVTLMALGTVLVAIGSKASVSEFRKIDMEAQRRVAEERSDPYSMVLDHDVVVGPPLRLATKKRPDAVAGSIAKPDEFESFKAFYRSIRVVLESRAAASDAKASELLVKGIRSAQWGVAFYIVAIVAWQVVAHTYGNGDLTKANLIGFGSTSLLFIFIEFLGAWFLRQYRHFVDTATYLTKVKSIFDRYMLTYLAVQERAPTNDKDYFDNFMSLLLADIRWPDPVAPEAMFAREAMQSLTDFANAWRSAREFQARSTEPRPTA